MSGKYTIGSRKESEHLVSEWGFKHIFTWSDGRYERLYFYTRNTDHFSHCEENYQHGTNDLTSNAHYSPHSHSGLTTHLIRQGSFTITYPEDNANLHNGEVKKQTFGVGERIDVPAGKVHEVWIGDQGCEYVIGE
jgi:hypothetical protein